MFESFQRCYFLRNWQQISRFYVKFKPTKSAKKNHEVVSKLLNARRRNCEGQKGKLLPRCLKQGIKNSLKISKNVFKEKNADRGGIQNGKNLCNFF